jgi:LuxR family maltose regulon positive regulatory protein
MSQRSTLRRHETPSGKRRGLPVLRRGTVRRERLLQRLAQSTDLPIAVFVAPAGYGKTTLLVHWLEHDPRHLVWLSVAESDNEADRLATSIGLAIRDIVTPTKPVRFLRLAPVGGTVADTASALQNVEQPFVLVLDDAHRLRSARALATLRAVADCVPQGSQLVLASRTEPSLPIGRLRAEGRLIDLRQDDLVMTRSEAAMMLDRAGFDLPPEDVLVLLARTEGWPAALYLAALSLQDKRDTHRAVARFSGGDRLMADYLRDEFLGALRHDQRAFLRRTSILDRLSGPLCDAVLECQGSGEVLRRLSRANVLLVPLDSTDDSYRYHRVLAPMLQAELGRVEPQLKTELHRRASHWYRGSGDTERAVVHAIEGGEIAAAGELLWPRAAAQVLDGRARDFRRLIARVPGAQVAAHPRLALATAATHLAAGDHCQVAHWAASAAGSSTAREDALVDAGVAVMRAAVAQHGLHRMVEDAARAYDDLPDDSPWRALCCLLQGAGMHLQDAPDRARALLQEGARRGVIDGRFVQALCLAHLALIELDEGDIERAALSASRARAQIERLELGNVATCSLVFAVSALIRAAQARVEGAQADRHRATVLLAKLEDHVPWYEVETRIVLARTALRLGDVTGTRTLLGEVERLLPRVQDAVVLRRCTDDLCELVDAFAATALVAPSSLTTAELRVLALMPTHLSFREMGGQLHVSANTVKTHAHAVYRKLNVRSRSDAVGRASEAGLLNLEETLA